MKKHTEFDILYEIKEEVYKTIKTLRTKNWKKESFMMKKTYIPILKHIQD